MGRKNIKVPEPLFNALRDDKDDTQSWPHYLETECLGDELDERALAQEVTDLVAGGEIRIEPEAIADAVAERVNTSDTVTLEASERRAIAQEVAEVLQR